MKPVYITLIYSIYSLISNFQARKNVFRNEIANFIMNIYIYVKSSPNISKYVKNSPG